MSSLEEKFQEASLRGHDEVTGVITDVELEEEFTDNIVVHYRIGAGDGETIEDADHFEVPVENDEWFKFVRLCRAAGVALPTAHKNLVGQTIPVESDGEEWEMIVPSQDGSTDDSQSEDKPLGKAISSDRPLKYATYITVLLLFPLYSLPFGYNVYQQNRDEPATAFGLALILPGIGVGLWLFVPLFFLWMG
jgi:hypothetical protein